MAREKKVSKKIEGSVLTITAGEEVLMYDSNDLSDAIKAHLIMHGLSQKLGDSAAGAEDSAEAAKSIAATWDVLAKGEWSSRQPAGEKITKKGILDKYADMSEAEQAAVKPLLLKLGLIKE